MSDTATKPTSYETGTAEAWLTVLDYVSRVAQAVEGGDWHYLADKSDGLERAVGALRRRIWDEDTNRLDVEDPATGKPLRGEAVMEVVRRNAGLYRASQALYGRPNAEPLALIDRILRLSDLTAAQQAQIRTEAGLEHGRC